MGVDVLDDAIFTRTDVFLIIHISLSIIEFQPLLNNSCGESFLTTYDPARMACNFSKVTPGDNSRQQQLRTSCMGTCGLSTSTTQDHVMVIELEKGI